MDAYLVTLPRMMQYRIACLMSETRQPMDIEATWQTEASVTFARVALHSLIKRGMEDLEETFLQPNTDIPRDFYECSDGEWVSQLAGILSSLDEEEQKTFELLLKKVLKGTNDVSSRLENE